MYRMTAAWRPTRPTRHAAVPRPGGGEPGGAGGARGEAARLGLRLSTHPGQYVVLNSEDERTRALAVADLDLQAEILDAMGLGREAVVVVHVGGAAGGREAAMDRFLRGFERLSERARARLAIENDDRTFALRDVLGLAARAGVPVVWDVLHHHCNDPDDVPEREALELALASWPDGVRPKIHYSSPKTALEERVGGWGAAWCARPCCPSSGRTPT